MRAHPPGANSIFAHDPAGRPQYKYDIISLSGRTMLIGWPNNARNSVIILLYPMLLLFVPDSAVITLPQISNPSFPINEEVRLKNNGRTVPSGYLLSAYYCRRLSTRVVHNNCTFAGENVCSTRVKLRGELTKSSEKN